MDEVRDMVAFTKLSIIRMVWIRKKWTRLMRKICMSNYKKKRDMMMNNGCIKRQLLEYFAEEYVKEDDTLFLRCSNCCT